MSDWKKSHRDIAAAHLCDLAAHAFREGGTAKGIALLGCAENVAGEPRPEAYYREGLAWAAELLTGDAVELGDAAVGAILRGEPPLGSLVTRVEKMRGEADESADRADLTMIDGYRFTARVDALDKVLDLLGCAPGKRLHSRGGSLDDARRLREALTVDSAQADRALTRALVDALPRCTLVGCSTAATHRTVGVLELCDEHALHADEHHLCGPRGPRYAVPLRALLAQMATWPVDDVAASSPLAPAAARAEADRLRQIAGEAQDDYMRAECHARALGAMPGEPSR